MSRNLDVVLVGIGGYGVLYVREMLSRAHLEGATLVGVVDPNPKACPRLGELEAAGIPVHATLEAFYAEHNADLAVISAPIQYHAALTEQALACESHVLCEKPAAANLADVRRMMRARDAAGKIVAIGYQWSFSEAILALKRDILAGRLGRPRRLKTIVLWPRDWKYYARGWAGKKLDAAGRPVMDSVAANATAHYLHNLLYLLGDSLSTSAVPALLEAEVYRANAIENFDTAAFRMRVGNEVSLLYLVSHAITPEAAREPEFELAFEHARVTYKAEQGAGTGHIRARFKSGETVDYGNPFAQDGRKLWLTLQAIRNGGGVPCGLEAAASHTACMDAVHAMFPEVPAFPDDWVVRDADKGMTYVKGLAGQLNDCYDNWRLPSQNGAPWAVPAIAGTVEQSVLRWR